MKKDSSCFRSSRPFPKGRGRLFRSLLKYQEKTFWQEHPTIYFDTLYEEGEYEVLAAFYNRVYYQSETCFKFYQFIDAADEEEFYNEHQIIPPGRVALSNSAPQNTGQRRYSLRPGEKYL